jgi:hypothetical protein
LFAGERAAAEQDAVVVVLGDEYYVAEEDHDNHSFFACLLAVVSTTRDTRRKRPHLHLGEVLVVRKICLLVGEHYNSWCAVVGFFLSSPSCCYLSPRPPPTEEETPGPLVNFLCGELLACALLLFSLCFLLRRAMSSCSLGRKRLL